MKLPEPSYRGGPGSLHGIIEANLREEEARLRRLEGLTLDELFGNLRSRDRLTKSRVRKALPARDDSELMLVAERLVQEAASRYAQIYLRWQREAVGYLTSLGAEALSRTDGGVLAVPDDLDFVGLQTLGESGARVRIEARRMGNYAGMNACHLDLEAVSMGDYCLRQSCFCRVEVETAGRCLGEEAEEVHLKAHTAGDYLMVKSSRCVVEADRVGRLAGLDSDRLEMRVRRVGADSGARARGSVIQIYRELPGPVLRGRRVVLVRRGSSPWRFSLRIEKTAK